MKKTLLILILIVLIVVLAASTGVFKPSLSAEEINRQGENYYYGRNAVQDYEKAAEYFIAAAKLGNAAAQEHLGTCYRYGYGVMQDNKKTVEWYTKAAEQGLDAAQNSLGYCYEYGLGVEKDTAQAVEWYTKASEQGNETAKTALDRLRQYKNTASAPEGSTTSQIKVVPFYIMDEYGQKYDRNVMPWFIWPTLCPGETLTFFAVVYPIGDLTSDIVWSCYDTEGRQYPVPLNDDGSVTFTCTGTEPDELIFTANLYGSTATITIYQQEASEIRAETENQKTSDNAVSGRPTANPEITRIRILNENNEEIGLAVPTLLDGESVTLHAEVFPESVKNPEISWSCSDRDGESVRFITNDDGSVTLTCLNAVVRYVQITAKSGRVESEATFRLFS